ncbi:hypothetical protein [Thalassobellus citreus]|uniref:hypothetical protein n=1 Tax=Thalassobellus citreus TaxID=3367752 RepID=UPI0037989ED2
MKLPPEISFITSFYQNYIFELDKVKATPGKIEAILDKYFSVKFLEIYNSYEYLDYNPFINGQDYPENFINNLKIKNSDTKLENRYIIYQTYNEVDYELLQMEIIRKEEDFKINKLYLPNGSEMLSMQSNND